MTTAERFHGASGSRTLPAMDRRLLWISAALVAGVLVVFGRALGFGFIDYDLRVYITENANVRTGLSLENARWAFTSGHAANWHPLTWLSHQLDCSLYGLRPSGHHASSLALHAGTVVLLFVALARMTGRIWSAALVAALFAWHPQRVESVVWVIERKDVLSGFWFAAMLVAYERFVRGGAGGRGMWGVSVCLALGLLAKPILVTAPFVLLLLDVWPLARTDVPMLRRVVEKLPLFALVLVSSIVTFLVQDEGGATQLTRSLDFAARAWNASESYFVYVRQALWPTDLASVYPHPALASGYDAAAHALRGGLALGALALAGVLAWRWRRCCPAIFTGWFWYLGMLVPVIGLVQVGHQARADRYTYLPTIGLALMAVFPLGELLKARVRVAAALALTVLAGLGAMALHQVDFWRGDEALHRRSLEVNADNHIAHYFLGCKLLEQGRLAEALSHLRRTLELRPNFYGAHLSLADAYVQLGDAERATSSYQAAAARDPSYDTNYRFGFFLQQQQRWAEALEQYDNALRRGRPDDPESLLNRGLVLARLERTEEAFELWREAQRMRPGWGEPQTYIESLEEVLRAGGLPGASQVGD